MRRRSRTRGLASLLARWALLVAFAGFFGGPILWMVLTSVRSNEQILPKFDEAGRPVPSADRAWHPENYPRALETLDFWRQLRNSTIVCVGAVLGTLLTATLAAYGFARLHWPGRDAVFWLVLSTLMLPSMVLLLPQFVLFRQLHLVGTFIPLILPWWLGGHPFFVFLLRQFFLAIPEELSDAARLDGAGELRILWSVLLPLSKPALVTVGLFAFVWNWTDFLGPLVYLTDDRLYTLSVGLAAFLQRHEADWSGLMAATAVVTCPVILLFLAAQRAFVRGITMTGLRR